MGMMFSPALLAQSHYLKLFNERKAWHEREMQRIADAEAFPRLLERAVGGIAYQHHLGAVKELIALIEGRGVPNESSRPAEADAPAAD